MPEDRLPLPTDATISGALARFAAGLRYEDLPEDVRARARMALLDALGCGLAGSDTDELRRIRLAMRDAAGGSGDTLLWGTQERMPLPLGALVNGAAIHAREMDDFEGCLHSGAVIVPSAFGAAVRAGASVADLLTAIVAGYDVARRVLEGAGGNLPLKDGGWHSTSVCGGFGAAAAVGRLIRLDKEQMQWARGFAGSQACGTWAFIPEGAMSKRVHPGFAAQAGVVAACLARQGVTAPADIFETQWGGFFPTYAGRKAVPAAALEGLGRDFRIRIVGFKPYAACRGTHSSIDAVLDLRRELDLRAEHISRVSILGNPTHVRQLAKHDVATMLDARFSLPYAVAVAIATGGGALDQFTPEAIRRPDILALARRVGVVVDERVGKGEQPFVRLHLNDGRVFERRVKIARGDRRNPLSEKDLRTKFRANAAPVLGVERAARLEECIGDSRPSDGAGAIGGLLSPAAA